MSTPPVDPVAQWDAALSRLDRQLDVAWTAVGRASLDELTRLVDALEVPADLPPLPHGAADRARAVLQRYTDLDALLTAAQREVRQELAVTERLAPHAPSVPRFIDRRT